MEQLYVKTAKEWREWLKKNNDVIRGVWLVFYKKDSGKPTISYEDALDEALCYGWIDSIIKKIDDIKYIRKFTIRNENSKWSEINKKKVEALIKQKRMTNFGLCKIEAAKQNRRWYENDRPEINSVNRDEFEAALNKNKSAKDNFNKLAPSFQKQYILWISAAKQMSTKEKRIKESISLLERALKLGIK